MNERAAYHRAISKSHRIRVVVKLFDHNEDYVATIDESLIAGQIDVDITRDIERSCSLTFADTGHSLTFDDSGSPGSAIYADNFVGVEYHVWVEELGKWVRDYVFYGPVTRYQRDGWQVSVEAQDKTSLLFEPVVWGRWLKNNNILSGVGDEHAATLLRDVLHTVGEVPRKIDFDGFENARLPKDFHLPKHPENLWNAMKRIVRATNARSENDRYEHYRLFYDGRGHIRVESMANGFHFTDDPETGVVLTQPEVSYDMTETRNTVVVRMNRGQGGKELRPVVVTLPDWHALSASKLSRTNVKRYLVEVVDNAHVRSRAKATSLAKATLRHLATETIDVQFDSLPVPFVIPGSECRLTTNGERRRFILKRYTLPLRATDSMSVGYLKRMRTPKGARVVRGIGPKRFAR